MVVGKLPHHGQDARIRDQRTIAQAMISYQPKA